MPEAPTPIQTKLSDSLDMWRFYRIAGMTRYLLGIDFTNRQITEEDEPMEAYNFLVEGANQTLASGSVGVWGHYDPYRPSIRNYKRLNHLSNNLRILTAQTRAIDVVPQWTNTQDELISQGRAGWWTWRSQGMDGLGGWKTDFDSAFGDFGALGEGYLRAGVVKAGKGNAVTVSHYHPLNVMVDPYAKYTNESRWVAFSTVYGLAEAHARFPKFDFEAHNEAVYKRSGIMAQGVRVIEYFSKKSDENDGPSYLAVASWLNGPLIEEGDNPFDDVLPYQSFLGFIPSGSDQPIGMVAAAMYAQNELTRIDDDFRKKSERDNLLGIPPDMFNADDIKAYAEGKRPEYLRLSAQYLNKNADPSKGIVTVPRNGENSDQKERRQELLGMLQQLSGISTLDMGQISGNDATATEVAQAAQRGQSQISYYSREFSRGVAELASKVGYIAKKYDTAPFYVNYEGIPVQFNGDDRRLTSNMLFDGPLNAVIGDEDLIMTDVNAKRAKEGQKWLQIYGVSQQPEAWRQYLLSQGIKNPADFMPQPPQPMMPGAAPPPQQPNLG